MPSPAYATLSDLQTIFGSAEVLIAFDRDADGVADIGVISAAIAAASEEIDSYLCIKYTLPLPAVPAVLTNKCCDIAMYRASINSTAMTEEKRTRYADAIGWLKDVAKGIAGIGVTEESSDANDEAVVATTSEARLFSRTKLAGVM